MIRNFLILLGIVFLAACGVQHRLQKSYTGKPVSYLEKEFGNPDAITLIGGDSVYIFKKTEELRSTEISQGKLALDPIVTPSAIKTERFYFTIKRGRITEVRTDQEYAR